MGIAILFLSLLLFAGRPTPMEAEEAWRVSVVPFRHSLDVLSGDSETLARLFETALIRAGVWSVVKQSEMGAILSAQEASLRDSADRDLAVTIGKVLSASHIFIGNVAKLGRTYVVSIQLVDVEKGRAVKAETAEAVSPEGFLEAMGSLASLFAGKGTGSAAVEPPGFPARRTSGRDASSASRCGASRPCSTNWGTARGGSSPGTSTCRPRRGWSRCAGS